VLRDTYADLGPTVRQALASCPDGRDLYYDQVAQIEMPSWTRGAVTLIGDAGLAVSLMAGQGASLAMGSAWLLAEQLRTTTSLADALGQYEKRMRPFVLRTQKTGRRTAKSLLPATQRGITLRRWVFAAMRLPGMKVVLRPALRRMLDSVVPR
jgi:2-polyprenyl-6-methoxyphenol hydroxylase-like FAD-dependent oxidoreductase